MNLFINCCAGRPPNSQDVNAANGGEGGGAAAAAAAAAGEDVDGHFVFPNSIEEGFKDIFGWMAENDDDMPKIRNMNELKTLYDVDWSPQGFLGKGHFATVHVGYDKRRQRKVAVKRIARSKTRMDTLKTEIRALLKVSGHPNIVELYDVFYDSVYVILVLEFLAGGELFTRIVKGGAYTERDASIHIRKIASALQYMHRRGVVHRDLKPENLVLKEATLDSEIKISDFGLSKLLRQDELYMSTVCGTRAYSSPEVNFGARGIEKKNTQYTYKVDTWSLGVILYVILAAFHPFDPYGTDPDSIIWERICRGQWDFSDKVWRKISDEAKDLIKHLICIDPEKRYGADEILQHPWITKYETLPRENLKSFSGRSLRSFYQQSVGITLDGATTTNTNPTMAVGNAVTTSNTDTNNNNNNNNNNNINMFDDVLMESVKINKINKVNSYNNNNTKKKELINGDVSMNSENGDDEKMQEDIMIA